MATIKVKIIVNELTNVLTKYDQIKVYRSDTEEGSYVEITDVSTRIDLVAGQTLYEYIDATAPAVTYWYRTSFYDTTLITPESSLSTPPIQGSDGSLIVSVQDIRDEGIDDTELSNTRALILSYGWQSWIEHMTGRWFYPKSLTMDLDGDGSRVLYLDVPIITLDELYINDDFTTPVDSEYYVVYNRTYPDDRRNPRIKLKSSSGSIYSGVTGRSFISGDQNQRVVGSFGYVEADGSAPYMIQRAIMTLIMATAELKSDSEIDQLSIGRKVEEVTDRHRVKFSDLYDQLGAWKPTGLTEVDEAIRLYRKPAYVGMARSM
jgi:hypothetical protein